MARLNIETLVIDAPDDFHHHLRDGPVLASTTAAATGQFKRAIIMPNLTPPVTTTALALAYRDRILAAMPSHVSDFTPLMTLYLTDKTTGEEIRAAKASGCVYAVKLYPAGATTNSACGVTDVAHVSEPLEAMQEVGLPLLVHGEVVAEEVDIFDREACFVESVFKPLVKRFPNLKFVMEHMTTKQGVEFVLGAGPNVAATITPQHLLYNRNGLLVGGIKPHLYCLPILKAEEHRQALLAAVASGNPKFFLGTDSAPHAIGAKESSCGCAGVFSAHAALALYAEAFESVGALSKLSAFASHHGADFYGLSRNNNSSSSDSNGDASNADNCSCGGGGDGGGRSSAASAAAETTPSGAAAGAGVPGPGRRMRLTRRAVPVPATLPFGPSVLVPLRAGETVAWACEWV